MSSSLQFRRPKINTEEKERAKSIDLQNLQDHLVNRLIKTHPH